MNSSNLQLGDTKLLWLLLTEDGLGVSGQFPTVEIRRNRDWYYIDFDTTSFVDVGGVRERALYEHLDSTGFYSVEFDPMDFNETQAETYTIFYKNDSTDYPVYIVEEVVFEDIKAVQQATGETIEFLRKILSNKTILRKLGIGQFEQEFYDDDSTSLIKVDDIVKISNEEIRTPRS